ncbi:glycosyltransferase involved in cell wall biosynthesis [Flavobacterium sp. 2755]|uniref:glycosyltransferase family 4 protein n=1 Tax=Flavobacterium sp. 2755 TaxID=2817765 RepID=UPI002856FB57|nr:glycosyltransferase family 4 protein [Flavobacterium sp. 2755]MDR6762537.1 glycosyltransferase involved in cell wall biosynthesis [Flavobacterium sp. 2755]
MAKTILISQLSLPYSKIGSWTTLYKNYICSQLNQLDYIVCEQPNSSFSNIKYSFVKNTFLTKAFRKFTKKRYLSYIKALDKIVNNEEKFIIQIVDNFYVVEHVVDFLKKRKIRSNCYIQFFYHSYPPFFDNQKGNCFFESIDELVLLTYKSYLAHKEYYTALPTKVSILHNGIDNKKFFKIENSTKDQLKEQFSVKDKKVFVWCSQDRPKKGLHIILEAWKNISIKYNNIELWIIGCEPKQEQEGVKFLGRIPNENIAPYLQSADCYLFSSLCQEGFPLSLTEALHSGCYCIASNVGGVSEIMQNGKFGKLIETPHFVSSWEGAIIEFIEQPLKFDSVPENLYTTEAWNLGMNEIIEKAKSRLD